MKLVWITFILALLLLIVFVSLVSSVMSSMVKDRAQRSRRRHQGLTGTDNFPFFESSHLSMDIIQEGYQSARKKIYTVPTVAGGQRSNTPHQDGHFPNVDGSDNRQNQGGRTSFISAAEVAAQLDRFRTLLKEKEGELLKVKHENILLKQVK